MLLYGIHAVEAALRNGDRKIGRLLMTENAENRLAEALAPRQAAPERVTPRDLDRLLGDDTVHQGVLLETEPLDEPTPRRWRARAEAGPLIVLDQVTDPHNVGAILRSAAVFGAAGLIMTRRHSPPLDGALAKSASGALEARARRAGAEPGARARRVERASLHHARPRRQPPSTSSKTSRSRGRSPSCSGPKARACAS